MLILDDPTTGLDSVTQADVVAAAGVRETFAYLAELPNALDRRWWAVLLTVQALTVVAYTTQANLFGCSVDPLTSGTVPVLGAGTRAIVWIILLAMLCMLAEMFLRGLGNFVVGQKVAQASIDLRRRCLDNRAGGCAPLGPGSPSGPDLGHGRRAHHRGRHPRPAHRGWEGDTRNCSPHGVAMVTSSRVGMEL